MLLLEIKTMLEEIKTKLTVIPMLSKAIWIPLMETVMVFKAH
jgi:hypothetical protein